MGGVATSIEQGYKLGTGLTGGGDGMAGKVALKQYGSRLAMKNKVDMYNLQKGTGVSVNKLTGNVSYPTWADSPQKQAMALQGYKTNLRAAAIQQYNLIALQATETKDMAGAIQKILKDNKLPEYEKNAFTTLETMTQDLYVKSFGKKDGQLKFEELKMRERFETAFNSEKATERWENIIRLEANDFLTQARSGSDTGVANYGAFYAVNGDMLEGFPTPASLGIKSNRQTAMENERKAIADKAQKGREFEQWQKKVDYKKEHNIDDSGKSAVFQKKIQSLMKATGADEATATKIATGALHVMKDPVTKEISVVDLTKQGADSETPAPAQKAPKAPQQTIWDLSGEGTGPMSAIKSGASVISGMVGGPVAGKTIQARQYITATQNDLIRSLSINPRFPVGEINRIKKEINISPAFFDNPEVFRNKVVAVDRYLNNRLDKEMATASNKKIPAGQRQAAIQATIDIQSFLKILGAPMQVNNDADYEAVEVGQTYIDPNGTPRVRQPE